MCVVVSVLLRRAGTPKPRRPCRPVLADEVPSWREAVFQDSILCQEAGGRVRSGGSEHFQIGGSDFERTSVQ